MDLTTATDDFIYDNDIDNVLLINLIWQYYWGNVKDLSNVGKVIWSAWQKSILMYVKRFVAYESYYEENTSCIRAFIHLIIFIDLVGFRYLSCQVAHVMLNILWCKFHCRSDCDIFSLHFSFLACLSSFLFSPILLQLICCNLTATSCNKGLQKRITSMALQNINMSIMVIFVNIDYVVVILYSILLWSSL